jgi:hypothetical protein
LVEERERRVVGGQAAVDSPTSGRGKKIRGKGKKRKA